MATKGTTNEIDVRNIDATQNGVYMIHLRKYKAEYFALI